MKDALLQFDDLILVCAQWVIDFCADWLSLKQKNLERITGIIGGLWLFLDTPDAKFQGLILCSRVLWGLMLVGAYLRSDARRAVLLKDTGDKVYSAVYVLSMIVLMLFAICCLGAMDAFGTLNNVVFLMITRIPRGPGKRRRKREHATESVKEWLGSLSWLPQPLGAKA